MARSHRQKLPDEDHLGDFEHTHDADCAQVPRSLSASTSGLARREGARYCLQHGDGRARRIGNAGSCRHPLSGHHSRLRARRKSATLATTWVSSYEGHHQLKSVLHHPAVTG